MTRRPVPVQTNRLANPDGTPSAETQRFLKSLGRSVSELSSGKASNTQTWEQSFFFEYPEAKDYKVVVKAPVARTITSVTTVSTAGTATVTVKINSTALGGTANSVSTSEQTQAHSSDHEVAADDDIVITFSSVSGVENVSVTLSGTVTLA